MMHEHGNTMHWRGMLTCEMWEKLNDDQKKALLKRMLDGHILMKENWIKHLQFKIETMKMARKMVDEW